VAKRLVMRNNALSDRFCENEFLYDDEIERAKSEHFYGSLPPFHEHNDCIRAAYEWLDAQVPFTVTSRRNVTFRPLKHIIERWFGRYITRTDVEIAASMHPSIRFSYDDGYNLGEHLILPSPARVRHLSMFLAHDKHTGDCCDTLVYRYTENDGGFEIVSDGHE